MTESTVPRPTPGAPRQATRAGRVPYDVFDEAIDSVMAGKRAHTHGRMRHAVSDVA
jgi:hypothetical protein